MLPISWLKAAPWIAIAVLVMLLGLATHAYIDERDQFLIYRTSVKTLGEASEKDRIKIETERKDNLEKVRKYEKEIPDIRNAAVAAYRMRHPNTSCSAVPNSSASISLDDGAGQKPMVDEQLIQDCSDDAAKVEAWREWARLNGVPVVN